MSLKGNIHYKFKGMDMQMEPATVVLEEVNLLIVSRDVDNQEIEFTKKNDTWMIKSSCNLDNPLFGTCFIYKT